MGTREDLREVLDLMDRGYFRPAVDKVFPMDRIADAHRYLETASQAGKVVVTI